MGIDECFYCKAQSATPCPHCGELSSCCANHLNIHRPDQECLPWTVEERPGKGRVVVALRDIKPFQTVIQDRPAIVGPFDDLCSVCLECWAPVEEGEGHTCSSCGLLLCRAECEGGRVHQYECGVLGRATPRLEGAEAGVYSALSPLRMLAVMEEQPEVWDRVVRLMDHLQERRQDEKWQYVTQTVLPLVTQRSGLDVPGELLEKIIGIFRTNSVKWERAREGGGMEPVGHALCPLFSLMSHSCVNNTRYTQTKEGNLLVRAVRRIAKGEEVTTQYRGPNEGNIFRRPDFPGNWLFSCSCIRCQDPTELGTHASTLLCPGCMVPALLPSSPALDEEVWQCQACSRQDSSSRVLEVVRRLDVELSQFPYSASPSLWEELLSKFKLELHPDHFLCMKVKRLLLQLYGSREGFKLSQLPRSLLDRKVELCRNYMKVFEVLEPGYRLWRGRVLEELVGPLTLTVNQDLEEGNIDKVDYIRRYKEIVTMVKESAKCRQFEERDSSEGLVAQFYQSWMNPLESASRA